MVHFHFLISRSRVNTEHGSLHACIGPTTASLREAAVYKHEENHVLKFPRDESF